MSEIKSETMERMPESFPYERIQENMQSDISRKEADDVYASVMEEHLEDYYETIGNMPIREYVLDTIEGEGGTFAEYCDKHGIQPEDCYEAKVAPYHAEKMEEMGLSMEEYCNENGFNVDDILADSSCLRELYEKEKMED